MINKDQLNDKIKTILTACDDKNEPDEVIQETKRN